MSNTPPNESTLGKIQRPSGQLEKLYCKKCKRQLTLRDIDIKDNMIKCKTCGVIVLKVEE